MEVGGGTVLPMLLAIFDVALVVLLAVFCSPLSALFMPEVSIIHARNLLAVKIFFASFICRQLHPLYLLCPAQSRGFLVLMKSRKSPPSNNFEKHCHFMWQRASTCWISAGLLIAVADVVTAGFQRSS